ncbi:MAG TPA: hypothetical protein DCQ89_06140, partial [Psychrobacter sp.]|nr:hypothetical protein [Psychrobacter sp.]
KEIGFTVSDVKVVNTVEEIQSYYESVIETRSGLDFEIDGMVIKVDDLQL